MDARWKTRAGGAIAGVLLVASCGGGGGGGSTQPPTAPPPTPPPTQPTDPLGAVGTDEEERSTLFEALGEAVFAPDYADLRTRADELEAAIGSYCSAPTASASGVDSAWRTAMAAWQEVQMLAVGPVEESNHRYRLQFFPDNNEAVERGVDQALASSAPITEEGIAQSSVGVQGLPALEYLLFAIGGWDDADAGPRRCELATAVGANIATISAGIAEPWQTGGAFIDQFVNVRGAFDDSTDVLTAIFEAATHHAEFIADRKLRDAVRNSNPDILESHYATNSLANITSNLAALRAMFDTGEDDVYRMRDYLERSVSGGEGIGQQIADQLDAIDDVLAAFDGSLEAVISGHATGDAEQLRATIRHLANLFLDAAVAAGLDIGFNNQDGD